MKISALYTLLIALLFSLLIIACEQKSEYQQKLEIELAKNVRVDSLFLGYHLGMSTDEFFKHSWELNKQEIVTGQTMIHYNITNLKSPATMDFYPEFRDGKIYKMPVEIHYNGWAPWNRELFSDSLMLDLADLYKERYDANFIKTMHPQTEKEALIDIQGNRQISIYKRDDRIVSVEFLDLTAIEENP